jgi:hypothetical protein
MPIIIDTGALLRPLFTESEFTPTEWETAQGKADFGNKLCKFIAADFKQSLFTKQLYGRLHNCFGHIAHYNIHGFFGTFFSDLTGKIEFLELSLQWPCYGDPTFTFCDVERAVIARLRKSGLLESYRALRVAEIEKAERMTLARLKAQYEGVGAPAPSRQPAILTTPAPRTTRGASSVAQPTLF